MTGTQIPILFIVIALAIAFVITIVTVYLHTKKMVDTNAELEKKQNVLLERNLMLVKELEEQKAMLEEQNRMIEELKKQQDKLIVQTRDDSLDEVALLQAKTQEHREHIEATANMTDSQLMDYIEQQMEATQLFANPNLSLKDVSNALGLTQRRIILLFKQHEKYANLNDYLTEKRFLLACKLMRENPQWTVEAVAQAAGFQTRRTFQEVVKAHVGLTPSQLRQTLSSGE